MCILYSFFYPGFSMATVSPSTILLPLLLLLHFLTVSLATQDDLIISTKNGKVQGKLLSVPGGEVRAFLGIPYGKPPTGMLKFRAPEPAERWEGVRDATKFPNSCWQLPDTTFPGRTHCVDRHNVFCVHVRRKCIQRKKLCVGFTLIIN